MALNPTPHAFTVEEWDQMGEAGIFGEDYRVELIEGEILEMSPIGSEHMACVNRLTRLLVLAVGDQAIVSVQNPVRLERHSEPQPDFVLLRPRADGYRRAKPAPDDTLLVVEVSDSTLAYDLGRKSRLYARTGVTQAWVVDLGHDLVRVLSDPAQDGYRSQRSAHRGEQLPIADLSGVTLAVHDVLGPHP